MRYTITPPTRLKGDICLPASKSISNRALIMVILSGGRINVSNLSQCDDTQVMLRALRERGAVTDIGAAGTAMRFLTAYFASTDGETVITGSERMKHRPIRVLVDALRSLGADISYEGEEGFPPLRIRGRQLEGGRLELAGNVSSQYITALMMIAPTMKGGLRLRLTGGVISRAYIDMTMNLMHRFGAMARWAADDVVEVDEGGYGDGLFVVENDWSASSYWYEMMALSADSDASIGLPGLFGDSWQGDSHVADLFRPLGVETEWHDGVPRLRKSGRCVGRYEADLGNQPDLAQTLVVTCAMLGITFRITGLQTLRIKETDRLTALRQELAKLGYAISESGGDTLSWDGERCAAVAEAAIDTYDDHRMAMAFAPCALVGEGITINNPQVVSKSYPQYWDDLLSVGFSIAETDNQ